MFKRKYCIGLMLCQLLLCVNAFSTTYYVSPLGSDSNSGATESEAFQGVQRAIDWMQGGDTLVVLDGFYTGSFHLKSGITIRAKNPSRISAHDVLTGEHGGIWQQHGPVFATQGSGRWKIEFVENGECSIVLRRFPRESSLAINEIFTGEVNRTELEGTRPASVRSDLTKAYLYVANVEGSKDIEAEQDEVPFTGRVPGGKYDMEAQPIDTRARVSILLRLYWNAVVEEKYEL